MNKTPITDALATDIALYPIPCLEAYQKMTDHARGLEIELTRAARIATMERDAARAELAEIRDAQTRGERGRGGYIYGEMVAI